MPSKLISTRAMTSAVRGEEAVAGGEAQHICALRVDDGRSVRLGMAVREGRGEIGEPAGGGEHLLAVRLAAERREPEFARVLHRADLSRLRRHGGPAVED